MIKHLVKIDRLAAWGLLLTMLAYFISGYGMTKGLIPAEPALKLHNNLLPILAMVFFTIHTYYAIHLALKRWRIWNLVTKLLLFLLYLFFVVGFVYVDQFYQKSTSLNESSNNQEATIAIGEEETEDEEDGNRATPATGNGTTTNTVSQFFTLTELAKYNGLNGNPPYVAVDGVVYDMTGVFDGGSHFGHKAGTELSDAFYLRHVKSQITKYPVAGTLN